MPLLENSLIGIVCVICLNTYIYRNNGRDIQNKRQIYRKHT